jgi:hypothetical protein
MLDDTLYRSQVGQRVSTRTEAPEPLVEASQQEFRAKAGALAPRYRTQLLPPPGAGT